MAGFKAEIQGIPELKQKLSYIELQAYPRAMSKTLNRVATTVRAEQARAIKAAMGVSKVSAVKRRIHIRRASPGRLAVQLEYRGRPLNLIEFKARQLKKGVKAQPWGEKKTYAGAFIVEIGGNDLVFIRRKAAGGGLGTGPTTESRRAAAAAMATGRPNNARGGGRLPIRAMWGPGIADTAAKPEIAAIREKTVAQLLTERFESNLDYELTRIAKRGA